MSANTLDGTHALTPCAKPAVRPGALLIWSSLAVGEVITAALAWYLFVL
jgi:hypothetical protein